MQAVSRHEQSDVRPGSTGPRFAISSTSLRRWSGWSGRAVGREDHCDMRFPTCHLPDDTGWASFCALVSELKGQRISSPVSFCNRALGLSPESIREVPLCGSRWCAVAPSQSRSLSAPSSRQREPVYPRNSHALSAITNFSVSQISQAFSFRGVNLLPVSEGTDSRT